MISLSWTLVVFAQDSTSSIADTSHGTGYYSPLAQMTSANVQTLGFAWEFKTGTYRGLEATPIVADGIMYTSGIWGIVYALDAVTGRLLWQFDPHADSHADGQAARYASVDVVNRGVVVHRGKIYVTAVDCRMFALDARTGAKLWEAATAEAPPYACSGAPLIAGHVVVMGNAGSDTGRGGLRGYVSAYDLDSGARRWKFYTVPKAGDVHAPAEMRAAEKTWDAARDPAFGGGGNVWDGMAYDPEQNRVFIGTGNAAPYLAARAVNGRVFDRLYAASIVALDADSGHMAWYYQTTPGDIWDLDASAKMVIADLAIGGRTRKTLLQANKNGYFYVLDRISGKPISARAFTYMNWSTGLDAHFRPIVAADADYTATPRMIYPGAQGAHGWAPMSYSPASGLVYIPTLDVPNFIINLQTNPGATVKFVDGGTGPGFVIPDKDYHSGDSAPIFGQLPAIPNSGPGGKPRLRAALKAWDPIQQKLIWEQQTSQDYLLLDGGALSTAGNLVFAGREDGRFVAYAADNGHILKVLDTGTATIAAPMTYEINGTQYVAVMQGHGGSIMFSLIGTAAMNYVNEGRILVLKLGGPDVPKPAPRTPEPYRQPPARVGTAAQISTGRSLFYTWCSKCHTLGAPAVTPDLSRLNRGIGSPDAFKAIVLQGALLPLGMARFNDVLSPDDADDIHAFLVDQSWQAFDAEQKRTPSEPRLPGQ
jgi:quinohemoprotein ethanol dehydrogenase